MIEQIDRGEKDNKILVVAIVDPEYNKYEDLKELPFDYKAIFKDFFDEIMIQKNKIIKIKGYYGKKRALKELSSAMIK